MRRSLVFILWMAAGTLAAAQDLPRAPVAKPDRARAWWMVEAGTLGGAYAADFTLTQRGLKNPQNAEAHSWLYGAHPSNARITAEVGAMYAGESFLLWKTEHSRRPWIRWAGRGLWVYGMVSEARAIHSWRGT